jgi:hypothetical protein
MMGTRAAYGYSDGQAVAMIMARLGLEDSPFSMPPVGIEPTTFGLKVRCSAS